MDNHKENNLVGIEGKDNTPHEENEFVGLECDTEESSQSEWDKFCGILCTCDCGRCSYDNIGGTD